MLGKDITAESGNRGDENETISWAKVSMSDEDIGYFTAQQISEAIYSVLTDRGLEFESFAWSIEVDLLNARTTEKTK